MTKDEFKQLALGAIETLTSMPDDLWNGNFPYLSLKLKDSNEAAFVGIKETETHQEEDF